MNAASMIVAGIGVALIVAGAAMHNWGGGAAACRPALCGEQVFDAGVVTLTADSRIIEHRFEIRNCSTVPITILGITTTCGCTKAQVSTRDVAPGATTTIGVQLSIS